MTKSPAWQRACPIMGARRTEQSEQAKWKENRLRGSRGTEELGITLFIGDLQCPSPQKFVSNAQNLNIDRYEIVTCSLFKKCLRRHLEHLILQVQGHRISVVKKVNNRVLSTELCATRLYMLKPNLRTSQCDFTCGTLIWLSLSTNGSGVIRILQLW